MTLRTAIIGSGNIGCDILAKVLKSPHLTCSIFAGRSQNSKGLSYAKNHGVKTSSSGIDALLEDLDNFDLVFDATSAMAHMAHAPELEKAGKIIVNLTPAPNGKWCVPVINGESVLDQSNINMITCGGQASLPILKAISQVHREIEYIEVVSSISAKSAGAATRINLDEYINTTQKAITYFTGCTRAKAILNINPAEPCVSMQTAISAIIQKADLAKLQAQINKAVTAVAKYVPGYELIVETYVDANRVFTMIKVTGQGDFLPAYAGNLDIITCASVNMAEKIALGFNEKSKQNICNLTSREQSIVNGIS